MERTIPLQPLKTREELEAYIIQLLKDKDYKGDPCVLEDVMRFVASRRAAEADESMSRRELTELFLEGIPKLTDDGVKDWLWLFFIDFYEETVEDGLEAYFKESYELLDGLILEFFGIREKKDQPAEDDSEGGIPD